MQALTPHERSKQRYDRLHSNTHSSRRALPTRTELDVLLAHHKFLHPSTASHTDAAWEDQLAFKYYESLFREFALVNLKKYKSGKVALRWRTEDEVLQGTGERSCASLRCEYHQIPPPAAEDEDEDENDDPARQEEIRSRVGVELFEYQVPFTYTENTPQLPTGSSESPPQSEVKTALVKLILCAACSSKLTYTNRLKKRGERSDERHAKREDKKRRLEDRQGEEDDYKVELPPDLAEQRKRPRRD